MSDAARQQQRERAAILDTMGVGGSPTWVKTVATILIVILIGLTIWSLVSWQF